MEEVVRFFGYFYMKFVCIMSFVFVSIFNVAIEGGLRSSSFNISSGLNLRLDKLSKTDLMLRINFRILICAVMKRYCSI